MGRARSSWRGKGRLEGGGAQGEGMGEVDHGQVLGLLGTIVDRTLHGTQGAKLGVDNRTAAINVALRKGHLPPF